MSRCLEAKIDARSRFVGKLSRKIWRLVDPRPEACLKTPNVDACTEKPNNKWSILDLSFCQPWNSTSYCTRKSNCFFIFYIILQILSLTSIFKFYLRASFAKLSFQVNKTFWKSPKLNKRFWLFLKKWVWRADFERSNLSNFESENRIWRLKSKIKFEDCHRRWRSSWTSWCSTK